MTKAIYKGGEHGGGIDFSGWTFGIDIDDLVSVALTEAITSILNETPPEIWISEAQESDRIDVNLTLELPFGDPMKDERIAYEVSLADIIEESHDINGWDERRFFDLAKRFRAMADAIEERYCDT